MLKVITLGCFSEQCRAQLTNLGLLLKIPVLCSTHMWSFFVPQFQTYLKSAYNCKGSEKKFAHLDPPEMILPQEWQSESVQWPFEPWLRSINPCNFLVDLVDSSVILASSPLRDSLGDWDINGLTGMSVRIEKIINSKLHQTHKLDKTYLRFPQIS